MLYFNLFGFTIALYFPHGTMALHNIITEIGHEKFETVRSMRSSVQY
jgi:hypothetical protein